jgi:hypothetical protein
MTTICEKIHQVVCKHEWGNLDNLRITNGTGADFQFDCYCTKCLKPAEEYNIANIYKRDDSGLNSFIIKIIK